MNVLIVADSQRSIIEHSLKLNLSSPVSFWTATCPFDAQVIINVFPIDAVVLEFTFCEEQLIQEISRHHPDLPVIAVVDDPFMDAFQQLKGLENHSSLPVSEVSAHLDEVVQAAVAAGHVGSKPMSDSLNERRFSFELTNDKTKVTATVELLLDACEGMQVCTADQRFRLGIALEEALVNAIVHGNLEVSSELRERGDDSYEELIAARQQDPHYASRRVSLTCRISAESASFVIADQGPGFNVNCLPDPTDPDFLERPCGRGLLLMRSFMTAVAYNDRGNEVTMVYRNPAAPTLPTKSEFSSAS